MRSVVVSSIIFAAFAAVHATNPSPDTERVRDHNTDSVINMLQLNTWLIPVRPFFPNCLDHDMHARAQRLGAWLSDSISSKSLDIVLLEEVWSPGTAVFSNFVNGVCSGRMFMRRVIENSIRAKLPHITAKAGCPHPFCRRFFDSGLLIASRFPILREDFLLHVPGSTDDALSSKGVLVAALDATVPGTSQPRILIVSTSHLDAGTNKAVNVRQMKATVDFIESFKSRIRTNYPDHEIRASVLGLDMNIDGKEFWATETPYADVKSMMKEKGYNDAWMLTERAVPDEDALAAHGFDPIKFPELGITLDDFRDGPQRLDYFWIASENSVQVRTELNETPMWQYDSARVDPGRRADPTQFEQLHEEVDLHSRQTLLSDHAALFAYITFEK